jgi:hypothetical protein
MLLMGLVDSKNECDDCLPVLDAAALRAATRSLVSTTADVERRRL